MTHTYRKLTAAAILRTAVIAPSNKGHKEVWVTVKGETLSARLEQRDILVLQDALGRCVARVIMRQANLEVLEGLIAEARTVACTN